MAGHLLQVNLGLSSIFTQYEVNGYDNSDAAFDASSAHSSKTGTLEVYWIREAGSIKFVQTEDPAIKYLDTRNELGLREAEWYLCSRDTLKPCLMEPYIFDGTLLTSLVYPVVSQGQFRGVAGVDMNLPVLQSDSFFIAAPAALPPTAPLTSSSARTFSSDERGGSSIDATRRARTS